MTLHRFLLPALLAPSLLFLSTIAFAMSELGDGLRDDGRDVDGELEGTNSVDGFLTVGDDRFVLNYVYAIDELRFNRAARSDENAAALPSGTDPRVVIYLTDKPIPDEMRGDIAKIQELGNSGEIHGLELTIDPGLKKPRWTGRLLLGKEESNQVFKTRRGNRNFQLEDFERLGNEISAGIFLNRAFPRFDSDGERTGEKATFAVEFEVLVDKASSPTNTLEERKAWETPQAEILISAVDALRENDVDRFKSLAAANSEVAFLAQGPDKERFRSDLLNNLPQNPEKLRESIDEIIFFGDRAFLLAKIRNGTIREFIFLRELGQWKLSQG